MEELTLQSCLTVAGAAVVVAIIVQLVKQWVAERFVPLLAVAVGVGLVLGASAILGNTTAEQLGNGALTGLLAGASAIGIYDLTHRTVRGKG